MVIEPPPFTGSIPDDGIDHQLPDPTSHDGPASASGVRSVIGIDVGGSGIKAASVDPVTGSLISERIRITTPTPATPDAVIGTIVEVVERVMDGEGAAHLDADAPVGPTLPAGRGAERNGVDRVNIDLG